MSDYPQTSVSCIVRTQYPYFAQRYAGITGFGPVVGSVSILLLECQAHLVPGYVAVDGCGDAFIYEAELCVVMDELILAGQHQSFAALGFCIGDGALG